LPRSLNKMVDDRDVINSWSRSVIAIKGATNQANSAFHPFAVKKWVVKLQLCVCCLSCGGAIWWTLTKERQAWCRLQVKLCDPRLSALRVCVRTKMALYKYSSFPFLSLLNRLQFYYFCVVLSNLQATIVLVAWTVVQENPQSTCIARLLRKPPLDATTCCAQLRGIQRPHPLPTADRVATRTQIRRPYKAHISVAHRQTLGIISI